MNEVGHGSGDWEVGTDGVGEFHVGFEEWTDQTVYRVWSDGALCISTRKDEPIEFIAPRITRLGLCFRVGLRSRIVEDDGVGVLEHVDESVAGHRVMRRLLVDLFDEETHL
jgi:hypothetical protein